MVKERLYLVWQEPKSRRLMVVGELDKTDKYKFFYTKEYEEAKELGWEMLKPFPEGKEYVSDVIFPVFSSRLPDPKRRDIDTILKEYGLSEYDEFELLKKSGAKLPIDSYEFIDPIFPEDEVILREFNLSGVRHCAPCKGEDCSSLDSIKVGDEFELVREPNNEYDANAVGVFLGNMKIGFIPRFYSEAVASRLDKGISYRCKATKVDREMNCSECIQVRLEMPKIFG